MVRVFVLLGLSIFGGVLFFIHNAHRFNESTFENQLLAVVAQKGPTAGFQLMGAEYTKEPAFRSRCYLLGVQVADEVYAQHPDYHTLTLGPETTWCNYGFYQEFPRIMLQSTSSVASAKAFCLFVGQTFGREVPGVEGECFRGLGRGLVSPNFRAGHSLEEITAFAVQTCGSTAPRTTLLPGLQSDYETCISGVFHLLGKDSAKGKIKLDTADPYDLCRAQSDKDVEARCYGNFKWALLENQNLSQPKNAFANIAKIDSSQEALHAAAWTIGYDQTYLDLAFPKLYQKIFTLCQELPTAYRQDCIQGAAVSFAKNGTPAKQHLDVIGFCGFAGRALKNASASCVSDQTLQYLKAFYSPVRFASACADFTQQLGLSCGEFLRN